LSLLQHHHRPPCSHAPTAASQSAINRPPVPTTRRRLLLGWATCNARDFYPQGPGAYEKAVNERGQAFEHLSAAAEYVEAWKACAYDALQEKRVQRNRARGLPDHTPEPTTDP